MGGILLWLVWGGVERWESGWTERNVGLGEGEREREGGKGTGRKKGHYLEIM